jgi:hypothetical protein
MKSDLSTTRSLSLGLLGVLFFTTQASFAATTNLYGNYVGTSVTYANVRESSGTDGLPLFGAPGISGNTLTFDPTFTANAAGAGGLDITDGQLNMGIVAAPGNVIPSVNFAELGDFHLLGPMSANTFVEVSATFFIRILKVDGVSINPVVLTDKMTFAPSANGHFDHATFSGLGNFWSGSFNFDVNNALTLAGIHFINGATELSIGLDNTLAAVSEAGTVAFIAKKISDAVTITVPQVPEPSIFALTLCGAGFLFARRPRR